MSMGMFEFEEEPIKPKQRQPESSESEQWIQFDGAISNPDELTASWQPLVRLVPSKQPGYELHFEQSDVRNVLAHVVDGFIQVRVGALCRAMLQPFVELGVRKKPRTKTCQSGRTACIGGVEICCDDGRVLGSCTGNWDCRCD